MCVQNNNMVDMTINILIDSNKCETIANKLVNGEVTLDMLRNNQGFSAIADNIDDAVWNICSNNNPSKYQLLYHQKGRHSAEAEEQLRDIEVGNDRDRRKQEIIDALSRDCNAKTLDDIKGAGITKDDLWDIIKDKKGEIRNDVLDHLDSTAPTLNPGSALQTVPVGAPEVYFWGIPSSGKTCTLGAILSCAKLRGYYGPRMGAGLGYMNGLAYMFDDDGGICVPAGTPADTTQYLPLTLNKDGIGHNISLFELSGELFDCFSKLAQGGEIPVALSDSFNRLMTYLSSENNNKYHFFVIDCAANTRQQQYLADAALYFQYHKLFNKKTKGISLIVTKCDMIANPGDNWVDVATSYVMDRYPAFVNQLKRIVGPKTHDNSDGLGLTDGSLDVIPFSVGEFFFQKLCVYDPCPAENLVKLLMECSNPTPRSIFKR